MPRYFFNTRIGDDTIPDVEGEELRDVEGLVGREQVARGRNIEQHLLRQPHGRPHRLGAGEPGDQHLPERLKLEDQEVLEIVADLIRHPDQKVRDSKRKDDAVGVGHRRPCGLPGLTRASPHDHNQAVRADPLCSESQ